MGEQRAQGRHAGLTREQVLDTAVRLVDRDGVDALSMRKLAGELGVKAMTLYHYVKDRQELEDAIVERVLMEAAPSWTAGAPWQDVLAGYVDGLHQGFMAHPEAVILFATRPAMTDRNLAEVDALVKLLVEAGFTPHDAIRIVYALAASLIGQHLARNPEPESSSAVDLGAAADDVPYLQAALSAGYPTFDSQVALTVGALIAGFEALLSG